RWGEYSREQRSTAPSRRGYGYFGGVTITAHDTPGHTPGHTSWMTNVTDGNDTQSSSPVRRSPSIMGPQRECGHLSGSPSGDVGMEEKRAKVADGSPNPFVKPNVFNTYVAGLEKAFDEGCPRRKRR